MEYSRWWEGEGDGRWEEESGEGSERGAKKIGEKFGDESRLYNMSGSKIDGGSEKVGKK